MRRGLGAVVLVLGLLLVVAAPVMRWYVAPQLAAAPTDESFSSPAEGTAAVLFDLTSGQPVQNVPLTFSREVTPDADSSTGDTVVYGTTQELKGPTGSTIDSLETRLAFDGHTSELVNCCDAAVGGEPVGDVKAIYPYKFPFDTKKQTYDYFDTTLRAAAPIEFQGEERLEGLTVYRFQQTIEPTQTSTVDVPGALLGQPAPTVTLPRFYGNTRTLWVEPVTGVIVKGQEQQKQTLRGPDGSEVVTLLDLELTFTADNVADSAQRAKDGRNQLALVTTWIPLGALVLGLILLMVGLLMFRSPARSHA